MSFDFQREYEVQVLLGSPTAPPLWHCDSWEGAFPMLQSLARHARGVPVTSTVQFEADKRKPVKFGRIGWSASAQTKWTHSADTPHHFLSAEIWAPSRGTCQKDGSPPDLLFVLWNQGHFAKEVTFRDTVLLAVSHADPRAVQECAEVAQRLANLMQAKFHGRMKRPWARPYGISAYSDALGDMPTVGLFKVGPVYLQEPGNNILAEKWEPVPHPGAR